MMRAAFAFALGLLAGTILAACGGSSSHATKTATPAAGLTRAQYIAQADPICAAGKRRAPSLARFNALIAQLPTPTQELARLARKTAQVVKEVVAQLSALAPPPADRAAIGQWIAELTAIGGQVSSGADQAARGDLAAAFKTRLDVAAAANAPMAFATGYGLGACSSITS